MENKWTIIADSSGDLYSRDLTSDKIDFHTVPLEIMLESGNVVDDENLDVADFVRKMGLNKSVAKTACPPPEKFAEIMRTGENIIVVTISSKLSGTYDSAVLAATTVKKEFPDKKIYILDSLAATAGQARILFEVARLINNTDLSFDEVVAQMIPYRDKTRTIFFLRNLTNLVKNGRMSKIVGLVAKFAKLKLVCCENGHGEIVKHGIALTSKKALNMLAAAPIKKVAEEKQFPVVITHCFNETDANTLKELLVANFNLTDIRVIQTRGLASFYADKDGVVMGY
ncbi:MAG: DegV family protein [Christensenellaceae bacterium]|jgi:DegV family protein with EDD domain|nr:DegV family protein [Christensenellaceae bacterium]